MQFLKSALRTALLVTSLSLYSSHARADDSGSGITGIIQISPIRSGPIRDDIPNVGPLADTTFVVQNEKGVVTSFTTDSQGRFQVVLPPGHYLISKKDSQSKIGRFGPFEADVVAGKMTDVKWQCDSGRR